MKENKNILNPDAEPPPKST